MNILVLDTEVYSNTGGQMSKSTPRARWRSSRPAASRVAKKDLAMMAMNYGNVYVARVALGATIPAGQGVHRSRGLRWSVADHRLQPLHRPRHTIWYTASTSRRQAVAVRSLAAVPLQPGSRYPRVRILSR